MLTLTVNEEIEKEIIEQLRGYKRLCGRIKVLERQPVGMGYSVSRLGADKLQELHRTLHGLPSHMYLSKREQELELTAYAHLERYPAGIRSQHNEVRSQRGVDAEDTHNLKDLSRRVERVREARSMPADGYAEVDSKDAELRHLMEQRDSIANILEALSEIRPEFTALLRNRYIEGKSAKEVALILCIAPKTFDRWREKAFAEYARLMA